MAWQGPHDVQKGKWKVLYMENYHAICDWYSGICVWDSDYGSNYAEKDLRDLMDSKLNTWQQYAITEGSVVCGGPTPEQKSSEKQKAVEEKG